jgi:hypothetical protein
MSDYRNKKPSTDGAERTDKSTDENAMNIPPVTLEELLN